jgi:hypothetical protein
MVRCLAPRRTLRPAYELEGRQTYRHIPNNAKVPGSGADEV